MWGFESLRPPPNSPRKRIRHGWGRTHEFLARRLFRPVPMQTKQTVNEGLKRAYLIKRSPPPISPRRSTPRSRRGSRRRCGCPASVPGQGARQPCQEDARRSPARAGGERHHQRIGRQVDAPTRACAPRCSQQIALGEGLPAGQGTPEITVSLEVLPANSRRRALTVSSWKNWWCRVSDEQVEEALAGICRSEQELQGRGQDQKGSRRRPADHRFRRQA